MRVPLCAVLLLGLLSSLSSVSSSCRRGCLTCREKLRPAPGFRLQVCISQCEAKLFPSPLWAPCTKAMARGPWQLSPADPEPGSEGPGQLEQQQLQKRFGGFTGARKSARKLASQKRFSEFVRQYLVLSMQAGQRRQLRQNGGVGPQGRPSQVRPHCHPPSGHGAGPSSGSGGTFSPLQSL